MIGKEARMVFFSVARVRRGGGRLGEDEEDAGRDGGVGEYVYVCVEELGRMRRVLIPC